MILWHWIIPRWQRSYCDCPDYTIAAYPRATFKRRLGAVHTLWRVAWIHQNLISNKYKHVASINSTSTSLWSHRSTYIYPIAPHVPHDVSAPCSFTCHWATKSHRYSETDKDKQSRKTTTDVTAGKTLPLAIIYKAKHGLSFKMNTHGTLWVTASTFISS